MTVMLLFKQTLHAYRRVPLVSSFMKSIAPSLLLVIFGQCESTVMFWRVVVSSTVTHPNNTSVHF